MGIDDLVGMAAVGVAEVGAEGGNFDFERFLTDKDDAELRTDVDAVGKEAQHFRGRCVGGDVVIRGNAVEEEITHSAAREEGLISVALERVADRIGDFAGVHGEIMRQNGGSNEAKK